MSKNAAQVAELSAQVDQLTKDKEAIMQVATIAASQLINIETKFAPLLSKKINFWTALANLKQWIALMEEVLILIRDFKTKFVTKTNDNTAG